MTSSVSFLDRLNNQQREAVLTDTRSVLVVAGPGTGKTHTLTTRLAYLLNRQDITPDSLLALTFTTRAAREMRERLRQLVGEAAQQVFIGTFHSLCVHLLRAEGHYLGLSPTFQVCDRHDQVTILQSVLRRLARRDSRAEAQRILHQFSRVRNLSVEVELELERAGLRDIYEAYRERLRKRGLLDFDELLLLGVYVLERQPALRQRWAGQFRFLSVDEYQDVNPVQLRLIRGLWEAGSHLWAVGDGDQAIYSFRGTQPQQFLNFENDFPGGLVRFLEKSYRFPPHIAIAASQV
ncbi:MAG: ATP-dependent DNA helicase PcrA, partial [Nitrospirae bacterium]